MQAIGRFIKNSMVKFLQNIRKSTLSRLRFNIIKVKRSSIKTAEGNWTKVDCWDAKVAGYQEEVCQRYHVPVS